MFTPSARRIRVNNFLSGCLMVSALGLSACKPKETVAPVPVVTTPASATAPAAAAPAGSVAKVKGRWLRPDGGYILAITAIAADGRAEAGYFNPNPIKVAWATVTTEGAYTQVKVELRDQNYPGCLYKLTYLADKDRLVGTYFQAQQQQTYEVEFVREP
ncbi:MAG: hypothetical protein NTV51_16365 [Verrucomicrobia bacterium]|nr:hypothetical protein [Verrucomicrobiota bacterium]